MSVKPRVANCRDCSKPITKNKTGRCLACSNLAINSDPEVLARRIAGIHRKFQEAGHRVKMAEQARQNGKAGAKRHRAKFKAHGRAMAATYLHTPEGRAANLAARAKAGKARHETVMAWCPVAYRDEYRRLTISKRIPAKEAKEIILALARAELSRKSSNRQETEPLSLSPFERQERALARGAKLVANDRGPSFGEAVDHGESKWEVGRVA